MLKRDSRINRFIKLQNEIIPFIFNELKIFSDDFILEYNQI